LHLITVGWLTQTIWGVAFWLLPPASRERPHGQTKFLTLGFVLLNAGLILRVFAEPASGAWTAPVLALSAGTQWVAAVLAAAALWPRIKGASPRRRAADAA
jgi:hypothetical protein